MFMQKIPRSLQAHVLISLSSFAPARKSNFTYRHMHFYVKIYSTRRTKARQQPITIDDTEAFLQQKSGSCLSTVGTRRLILDSLGRHVGRRGICTSWDLILFENLWHFTSNSRPIPCPCPVTQHLAMKQSKPKTGRRYQGNS